MDTSGADAHYFSKTLPDDDRMEWVPLSLTLVEYPKGDLIGKLLALLSLAPFGIGSGFITLIIFRRDLHTIASYEQQYDNREHVEVVDNFLVRSDGGCGVLQQDLPAVPHGGAGAMWGPGRVPVRHLLVHPHLHCLHAAVPSSMFVVATNVLQFPLKSTVKTQLPHNLSQRKQTAMEDPRKDPVNKNKRSKTDQITQAVSSYLQKRNYPEISAPAEVNEDQMSLTMIVNSEVSRSNSISYTSFNSDPIIVDHSFSKFVAWLKDLHTKSKDYKDLDPIVAPLFLHLYIELHQKTHKERDVPLNLFKNHLPTIEKIICDDTLRSLINAIANDTLDCNNLKKAFRSNKYCVNISAKSATVLKKYLSENSHVVLLQILQTWFQFNEEDSSESEMEVEITKESLNGFSRQYGSNKLNLKNIYDAINAVKNETAPIYNVNLSNVKDEVNSGLINRELGIAVYSYNTNVVVTSLLTLKALDGVKEVGDVVLHEHNERIYDFSLIKNQKYLVSASKDLKLFDLKTYSLLNTYKGHEYPVYTVSTSLNGSYIISGSYDNSCRLWPVDSKDTLRLYAGHTREITAVDFHSNSMYFITGSADKNIRMWSINDASPVRLFLGSKGTIFSARFSPSGKYLATSGEDKRIRIWDLVCGKQLLEIKAGDIIVKLAWSGNDGVICGGGLDGSVKCWDFNLGLSCGDGANCCISQMSFGGKLLSVEYEFETFGCLTAQSGDSTYYSC